MYHRATVEYIHTRTPMIKRKQAYEYPEVPRYISANYDTYTRRGVVQETFK